MENMQAENTGGGLWQHEDASLQDVWASHDDTLHAKQVPHPASFKGSNEVQQKVTSGRRRYSSEEMLLLRNKWTHKPAAWNVVREDGKQLACCIDRRGFDWAAGIEATSALLAYQKLSNKPSARPVVQSPAAVSLLSFWPSNLPIPSPTAMPYSNFQLQAQASPAPDYSLFNAHPLSNIHIHTAQTPKAANQAGTPETMLPSSIKHATSQAPHMCCGQDVSIQLISALVEVLGQGDAEAVAQAAGQLAAVCKDSADDRHIARSLHAIPALLKLLRHSEVEVQESAAAAIWSISIDNTENQALLVFSGVMPRLVRLLGSRSTSLQYVASATLLVLISNHQRHQDIAAEAGAVPMLVHVLKSSTTLGKKVAAQTLAAIMLENTKNQVEVLKLGGAELLVDLLHADGSQPETQDAVVDALLALLSSHQHHEVVAAAGARAHLQRLLISIKAGKTGQNSRVHTALRSKVMLALKKLSPGQHAAPGSQRHVATLRDRARPSDDTVGP